MDVCNAVLNAPQGLPDDTPVYVHAPKGYERPGHAQVIRLRKAQTVQFEAESLSVVQYSAVVSYLSPS